LLPLFEWPEQEDYETIRPLVLFDVSVTERAAEVGTSTSTLYRRLDRFVDEGMESLFGAPPAKRKRLPPAVRRLIVDLKAEYPAFNLNEIANVVRACFGRKPDVRSVGRVLDEEPLPLKIVKNYPPYHETEDPREGRAAIVELRLSGWSAKAVAGYLGVHHATVYRTMEKWKDGGFGGLEDRPFGRPPGVRKADFAASERHEAWSADVRHLDMVDEGLVGGRAYAVTVMDNYSRAILSSAVTRRQDLSAFLSVLYRAVERHGAPGMLVTDSGSIFLANRAKAVYAKLGVDKEEIEKGRPWQNYSETTFGIQKRMADWHFSQAESWAALTAAHDRFVADYNAQSHFAHLRREDGRRSPGEVLSWVSGMRFHPKDLERAFFSERHSRVLDAFGYVTLMRWRLYAEEGLAGKEADLWILEKTLTVEHAGEPLSAYEVAYDARSPGGRSGSGRLLEVRRPTLFETPFSAGQMRLFGLAEGLGDDGWLKMLRLEDYAPRRPRPAEMLQQVLFAFTDAV